MTKLEQLQTAGIIKQQGVDVMNQEQRDKVEALSQEEVETLIQVYQKVGPVDHSELI